MLPLSWPLLLSLLYWLMGMTLILTSVQYRCTPAGLNRLMAFSSFQPSQINPSLNYPSIYPFLAQPSHPPPHSPIRFQAWGHWGQFSCLAKSQNSLLSVRAWACLHVCAGKSETLVSSLIQVMWWLTSWPTFTEVPLLFTSNRFVWQ